MVNSLGFIQPNHPVVRVVQPAPELELPLEPEAVLAAKPKKAKAPKVAKAPAPPKKKKKIVIKVKKPWGSKPK